MPTASSMADRYHAGTCCQQQNYRRGTDYRKDTGISIIVNMDRLDERRVYKAFFLAQRREGESPYAFAERVGIPRPRLYDILNNNREVTWGEVLKAADLAGLGMADLFAQLQRHATRLEERDAIRVEGVASGYADEATATALTTPPAATAPAASPRPSEAASEQPRQR